MNRVCFNGPHALKLCNFFLVKKKMKRVKRKIIKAPNPLFESWLKEWKEEARRNGSESQYCFGRALKSLKKYPFRLETGKECFILENFGTKLCMMLDKKLSEYNAERSGSGTDQDLPANLREYGKNATVAATQEVSNCEEDDFGCASQGTNHSGTDSLGTGEMNKRKNCVDSPGRVLKCFKDNNSTKCERRNKGYLPSYRSGSYAILLTLHKHNKEMSKAELEVEAQKLCDTSFKRSTSSGSYYTAWSSMTTLLKKELVEKNGRPARFSLTSKGLELALQLISSAETESHGNIKSSSCSKNLQYPPRRNEKCFDMNLQMQMNSHENTEKIHAIHEEDQVEIMSERYSRPATEDRTNKDKCKTNDKNTGTMGNCQASEEMFVLLPNEFDVILYVDNQEIESKQNMDSDKIVRYLRRKNINFEVKYLSVGDYLWICRDRRNSRELVLPYIVERKRIDDLASSIRDGRFHEQKFRLKTSGIQNCIYLVEKYGHDSMRLGLPLPSIQQAISNTRIVDGFNVKLTNNNDESLNYLSLMTNFFTRHFQDKTLVSCSKRDLPPYNMSDDVVSLMAFSDFNRDSRKMRKFTVRNMLVKHLLQFSGLSVERARAIVKVYPTPKILMKALEGTNGESSIAKITCGGLNRSIGSTIAKTLHQLYTSHKLT